MLPLFTYPAPGEEGDTEEDSEDEEVDGEDLVVSHDLPLELLKMIEDKVTAYERHIWKEKEREWKTMKERGKEEKNDQKKKRQKAELHTMKNISLLGW